MAPSANRQQARRGVVNKRFQPVKVLAGFMDDNHFRGFCQESLEALSPAKQKALLAKADAARTHVQGLPAHPDFTTEIRPLDTAISDKFEKDKTFTGYFGTTSHRFVWINPANLVALQVFVRGEEDSVPTDEAGLVKYALPDKWSVPAEISFVPPMGPIYIVSSSPHLAGLTVRTDAKKTQIIIEPPSHINLVQVMQFNGRYYLRNGYHRVVGALAAGVQQLPALIIDGNQPAEVELQNMGWAGLNVPYTHGTAETTARVGLHRNGHRRYRDAREEVWRFGQLADLAGQYWGLSKQVVHAHLRGSSRSRGALEPTGQQILYVLPTSAGCAPAKTILMARSQACFLGSCVRSENPPPSRHPPP